MYLLYFQKLFAISISSEVSILLCSMKIKRRPYILFVAKYFPILKEGLASLASNLWQSKNKIDSHMDMQFHF